MPAPTLRAVLGSRAPGLPLVHAFLARLPHVCILDAAGKPLVGLPAPFASGARHPIRVEDAELGSVLADSEETAAACAQFLARLFERESEHRSLAAETLALYREVHLIEQLSEELNAMLDPDRICSAALGHARRFIPATHGALLTLTPSGTLDLAASFHDPALSPAFLAPGSALIASVLERGIAEIVNDCAADARAHGPERALHSILLAPLRSGPSTLGLLALASRTAAEPYSAANLKLLHTIALQAASALRNASLCAEMVETARARAAYTAELQAASSVQQMLLQGASRPVPGFRAESVYLPASEVGGDFFFVQPGPQGQLLATIGDVSGKGLTAAMRVSMILGALRRETSIEPDRVLHHLNNVLVAQGHLGFTTACCVRIQPDGAFTFANAGHIAPHLDGVELESPAALPLGIVPDQHYQPVHASMRPGQRLVLVSDGVPEARALDGSLLGFERLAQLALFPVQQIAQAAQSFGQEDDITVLALALDPDPPHDKIEP